MALSCRCGYLDSSYGDSSLGNRGNSKGGSGNGSELHFLSIKESNGRGRERGKVVKEIKKKRKKKGWVLFK